MLNPPRDRNGEYEPRIIGKYSRNTGGMEEIILALYACGMSQRDISEQIKNLYDVEITDGLVRKIVKKVILEVNTWQNRPLKSVYPFIFMDAIQYKVKEDYQYITKAAYVVLGIRMDGFTGFREAIGAAFPKAQIQWCIVHQIRSSTKYVNWKDMKEVMADLKKIYGAVNEDEAMQGMSEFREKWAKNYPSWVRCWEENWDILTMFYAYPAEVQKIIYTTNIIEGMNRQFRKITKNKPSFTNDDSLRKMLYLASQNIVNHWLVVCRNWAMVSNQLRILFAGRETV